MANQITNVGFSDYAAEQADIERRRAYAQALQQQGAQPLGPTETVGGWAVRKSPLEGLARMLQAYGGRQGQEEATERLKALGERQRGDFNADRAALVAALQGRPADPGVDDPTAGYSPPQAAQAPNPAAMQQMDFRSPMFQGLQAQQLAQQMQPQKPVVVGRSLLNPTSGAVVGTDATWQAEQDAARKAKEAELQARLADARLSRQEREEAQRQLVQMQIEGRKELANVAASLRQPNQPQVIQTAQGPMVLGEGGKASPITDPTGAVVKPAAGRGGPMTATAQKELIETEEQMQGGQSALDLFKQARAINDKAMGFTGAGAIASVGTLLPEFARPDTVNATQNLDNILQTAALPQLKAIFGGMPTEGERKILLDVQGSSNKPASVRKDIFARAEKAIQARIQFATEKAKRLREGTYFSGEGLPSVSGGEYAGPERRAPAADPLGLRK